MHGIGFRFGSWKYSISKKVKVTSQLFSYKFTAQVFGCRKICYRKQWTFEDTLITLNDIKLETILNCIDYKFDEPIEFYRNVLPNRLFQAFWIILHRDDVMHSLRFAN